MARAFALQTLLDLARHRLDAAALELSKLSAQRQSAEAKLAQLKGFQSEYEAGMRVALAQGIESHRLRDYTLFLDKLARAIAAQAAEVLRCSRSWEEAQQRWLQLRSREQALGVLRERHLKVETTREGRREQKQQDEFALKGGPRDPSEGSGA